MKHGKQYQNMSDKKKTVNVTRAENQKTGRSNIVDTINTIQKEINSLEEMLSGTTLETFTVNALAVILTEMGHRMSTLLNSKLNMAQEYYKILKDSGILTESGQGRKSKKS